MNKRFIPKKKTSDFQDRVEKMPELFAEFQNLERAQIGTYIHSRTDRDDEDRMNYLDKLFGCEGESQMRKTGVETSHWEGRR